MRGVRRSLDQPFAQAALAAQPALDARHPAVVALVIVAEQVQQAVQRQHPQFGPLGVPAPRAPGAARRRAAITMSPRKGSGTRDWGLEPDSRRFGKRQHVGRVVLAAVGAVQRADARSLTSATLTTPRARAGATRRSHAARPGAATGAAAFIERTTHAPRRGSAVWHVDHARGSTGSPRAAVAAAVEARAALPPSVNAS